MHWRQVDVVCERASGIPCVCVVLLVWVACGWGRLYWCNNYHRFAGCPTSTSDYFSILALYMSVACYATAKLKTFLQISNCKTFKFSPVQVLCNTVVRCGSCLVFTYNKRYTCGNAFFHCRHPTVPKCGGSGPCLSGGELSGVCCQR